MLIRKGLFASLAFAVLVVASMLFAACGGGGEASPTPSVKPSESAGPTSPAAASPTPAGSPAPPPVLTINSVSPDPAKVGDKVTVTFKTEPSAMIGFQITDPNGQIAIQMQAQAGADGIATYDYTVSGATGKYLVEAAAGRSIADLLMLQIRPTTGPNTADATFQVQ